MKKAVLFIVVGLLVLWVTGIILENFFDVDLDKYFNGSPSVTQAATAESVPSDWKTYKYDDFHFSMASPYELQEYPSSGPASMKALEAKGRSPDMKFMVQVVAREIPDIPLDLNKVVDGQIKVFKLMDKIMANLQISTSPVTVTDAPGILAQGTYQVMGKIDEEIMILEIKKGTTLLSLMVQCPPTDENRPMADEIIHSISFMN
jgi:hypothetical protein